MNKKIWKAAVVSVVLALGAVGTVRADSRAMALFPNDRWVWRLGTMFGPQSYHGDVRVEGNRGSINSSLSDVGDRVTFQMDILAEGHGDRLGMLLGVSYLALNAEFIDATHAVNLASGLTSIDALGSCGLGPWDMGSTSAAFELLGGGRVTQYNAEIETLSSGSSQSGRGWVDPVVGGRLTATFDIPLRLELKGDWGGFGVGSATDLTWRFLGLAHYQLDPVIEVYGGYRITDIKSQHSSGTSGTAIDGRAAGPVIGITFLMGK